MALARSFSGRSPAPESGDISRQLARLRWLQEIATVIQHYANLPPVNVPDALAGTSYRQLRNDDIERIALNCGRLEAW